MGVVLKLTLQVKSQYTTFNAHFIVHSTVQYDLFAKRCEIFVVGVPSIIKGMSLSQVKQNFQMLTILLLKASTTPLPINCLVWYMYIKYNVFYKY